MTVAPDWALAVPTPGIHNAPAQIGGPPGAPIPLQQLGATMQFFIDVFVGKIAIAFGGIEILGWHPFQFLADWGQARIDQANANYILASTADGKAQDALDFIAAMVDGILGTGHTVGDFVDWLQDTSTNAATSISQWNSVISGLAVGDFSGLVAFFEGIPTDIAAAAADGAAALDKLVNVSVAGIYDAAAGFGNLATSLLKNLTPTGGNIGQFDASGLAGALGGTLTFGGTALSTFFGNINSSGGLLASGLTGAFNGAVTLGGNSFTTLLQYLNSSGQFAAGQLTGAINGGLTLGGVTLSTLVTNINSSGQILAAGITGALGTGLTVGGVTLSTLFTNINSSGQLLGAGITGALNVAATVSGQTLGTIQANAQGLVQGINNAAAGVTSGASSLLADAQTNLGLLLGAAPQFLQGLGAGVFGQQATEDAYAAAAQARSDQAAEQARIRSEFNKVFNVAPTTTGNVNLTIDFSGMTNAANMSGVMSPGNTNMGITSGVAVRQVTTAGDDKEVFPTVTTSDYQVITVTLGSLNNGYALEIMGRCNSARTTYTCVNIQPGLGGLFNVNLACYVSGTLTNFTYNAIALSSGGVLKFILGDPSSASLYAMQVLYNGTPIITYTDSSHVSQLGASYRYVGLRMVGLGSGQKPPAVRAVSYQDNPPPPAAYPFGGRPAASVDAKGRQYASSDCGRIDRDNGGAWENIYLGPKAWATQPPTAGWTAVNAGSSSFTADADAMLLTRPNGAGTDLNLYVQTLSPTSNYTKTFYLEFAAAGATTWEMGILLRRSATGAIVTFGLGVITAINGTSYLMRSVKWTNATTASAAYTTAGGSFLSGPAPNWYRIRDDGTNRYCEYSHNGVDWITLHSVGRTDFLGAAPDQIGVFAYNQSTGQAVMLRLRSFS